jgi:hypothetical protein
MQVDNDHLYYGAGVIQVAEDPHFTAINAFKYKGKNSRCAFLVNDGIGLYLKHRAEPVGRFEEYQFNFSKDNLDEIDRLRAKTGSVFIAMVCVKDREICCLPSNDLLGLIRAREQSKGSREASYTILVTAPEGKSLRAYINAPGKKGKMIGQRIIARTDFPKKLFEGAA